LERAVDLAAVGRVAKRVELKGVRLAAINAKCAPEVLSSSLMPSVELDCKLGKHGENSLEVVCDYTFIAQAEQTKAIESSITYLLVYEVSGVESPSESDLAEFARANGALHSWPFVRELLYGLTSRMGYPPFTLPVMHFNATAPPAKHRVKARPRELTVDEAATPTTSE
jgi:preprotein translocase subunit SecB